MSSSVDFWYRLISRSATVPGLYLGFLRPGLTAGMTPLLLLGALPPNRPGVLFPPILGLPRPLLCVCDVRAMITRLLYVRSSAVFALRIQNSINRVSKPNVEGVSPRSCCRRANSRARPECVACEEASTMR